MPIASKLYPDWVGQSRLDSQRAFIVRYDYKEMSENSDLRLHFDNAEVTLNVSLNKGFTGGELFFGNMKTVSAENFYLCFSFALELRVQVSVNELVQRVCHLSDWGSCSKVGFPILDELFSNICCFYRCYFNFQPHWLSLQYINCHFSWVSFSVLQTSFWFKIDFYSEVVLRVDPCHIWFFPSLFLTLFISSVSLSASLRIHKPYSIGLLYPASRKFMVNSSLVWETEVNWKECRLTLTLSSLERVAWIHVFRWAAYDSKESSLFFFKNSLKYFSNVSRYSSVKYNRSLYYVVNWHPILKGMFHY